MRLLIFTIFTYFVRARKIVFPYTSRDLGEGCRVGFFKGARKGVYLSYVTAAGVPQTKGKDALLYFPLRVSAESGVILRIYRGCPES